MLKSATLEGDLFDYAFLTQISERRIQHLLDWQWEEFGRHGHITARNYIIEFSFEQ